MPWYLVMSDLGQFHDPVIGAHAGRVMGCPPPNVNHSLAYDGARFGEIFGPLNAADNWHQILIAREILFASNIEGLSDFMRRAPSLIFEYVISLRNDRWLAVILYA